MIRDRTMALVTLAIEVIERYRDEKNRRGLLDYDDLIARTRDLLNSVDARWVHYKLDLGIDHLLIDEAQDTSPEQWDIIKQFVAEFTAGAGARSHDQAHHLRGRRRQAVDLLVPGRQAAGVRRSAQVFRAGAQGGRAGLPARQVDSFLPLGAGGAAKRSTRCSSSPPRTRA